MFIWKQYRNLQANISLIAMSRQLNIESPQPSKNRLYRRKFKKRSAKYDMNAFHLGQKDIYLGCPDIPMNIANTFVL